MSKRKLEEYENMYEPQEKKLKTDDELEDIYKMIGNLLLEDSDSELEYGPLDHCIYCDNYVENSLFTCNFCTENTEELDS